MRFVMWTLCALLLGFGTARARIAGVSGPNFSLTAKADRAAMPDGQQVAIWGYARAPGARAQYPGPTLIVRQGEVVTVSLTNTLAVPVSIVFPGQGDVTATGGVAGAVTREATAAGGTVTYSFTATQPGTYLYQSGTRPEVQVEMGLFGALIVRPALGDAYAYNEASTRFDYEYLFVLSEIDPNLHTLVAARGQNAFDNATYHDVYWCLNGRAAPDTLLGDNVPWLPTQPYGATAQMTPGSTVLMRVIGAGRQLHPFHHHGNHARLIARDGRLLSSDGVTADRGEMVFTVPSLPGETVDGLFTWTGAGMGWDIYGHKGADALAPGEDPADHLKALPVLLPENQNLTFGGFYSGSPFLGSAGNLPPGEGGLNPNSGYAFMWHSHTEKELTNNNVYPGGLLTMMIVQPPGTVIPR